MRKLEKRKLKPPPKKREEEPLTLRSIRTQMRATLATCKNVEEADAKFAFSMQRQQQAVKGMRRYGKTFLLDIARIYDEERARAFPEVNLDVTENRN